MTYIEHWTENKDKQAEQEDLKNHDIEDAQDTEREPPEMRGRVAACVHRRVGQYVSSQEPG